MKKVFLTLLAVIAAILFTLSACSTNDEKKVIKIRSVGTFASYKVELVRYEYKDLYVAAVIVDYTIDSVHIQTLANPSYDYILYTSKKEYIPLKRAYEQKLITLDDVKAIAEAEKTFDVQN